MKSMGWADIYPHARSTPTSRASWDYLLDHLDVLGTTQGAHLDEEDAERMGAGACRPLTEQVEDEGYTTRLESGDWLPTGTSQHVQEWDRL